MVPAPVPFLLPLSRWAVPLPRCACRSPPLDAWITGEEPHQEDHGGDGDVVGLGDDLTEIGVEQTQAEERRRRREQNEAAGLGPQPA